MNTWVHAARRLVFFFVKKKSLRTLTNMFLTSLTLLDLMSVLLRIPLLVIYSVRDIVDPVTWYGTNYAGTQVTHRDFENKGKSAWTGTSSFVLEVPMCRLRPSITYLPCDWSAAKGLWIAGFQCQAIQNRSK